MGTKIKCKLCNTIIEGDRKGNFITCKCGKTYIDETPYYCRIGGDPTYIMTFNGTDFEDMVLPENKYKRIDKINYYLNIAETVMQRSTCLKRHYGAIIVNNDEVISSGYNGAPRGILSCLEIGTCNRADSPRGTDYSHCRAVHAEQNAIISADRKEMINGTLYLVGKLCENGVETDYVDSPDACCLCKRMIINSGIKNIIVRLDKENYKEINVSDLTEEDIIGGY